MGSIRLCKKYVIEYFDYRHTKGKEVQTNFILIAVLVFLFGSMFYYGVNVRKRGAYGN